MDLKPQPAHIRRAQHEGARAANIVAISTGAEPNRFVRLYAERRYAARSDERAEG